ncbi:lasso peptide biosynthesis PqqD family chaperone [Falsibacillus pallidus]|uniref:Coenzyme PQQ synthesis protein D (PqqD) n=1 Tax=Falsibacillus pallidus TaxID=493781 RepID=A0A370GPT6_9BACI|nr:lasso peptide biosynthesis PqqD family chaperone [Falsibacillus pallidus]RDI45697.1 coenzyme PQQ synthesis protein D (PqqD) [Falsibacillus pallidus]
MIEIKEISLSEIVVKNSGYIESDMDGEKVMLSIENGKYYNLGKVGGEIWDLIHTPIKIETILSKLHSTYEIDENTCKEHVISFIETLMKEGLIKRV